MKSPRKKDYRKPEVVRVELRPEEAVLTACKTVMGGAAGVCNTGNCKYDQGS
jgi:hypothetical protein